MKDLIRKRSIFSLFYFVSIAFVGIAITGCDDDDDDNVEPVSLAYVSLYHASPNGPPVDILMENRQINYYPLQYTRYTGYLNFFSGERNMRVRPDGSVNVIIDTTFTFAEEQAYSLFYVNELANIKALLVEDEFDLPTAGNSAIRFIQLSPDAPAMDVVRMLESSGDDGDNGDNTMVVDNGGYLEATDFITVESGVQSYQVKAAGTDNVLLSIPDVNLLSGGVYTIVVRGFQTPPSGNTNNLGAQILINY